MKKTSKQKCLEMWVFFYDHPDVREKGEYRRYLKSVGRENEFNHCWACQEASEKSSKDMRIMKCSACPIKSWREAITPCIHLTNSPYNKWLEACSLKRRKAAAKKMIELIKTEWEEL